MSLLLNYRSGAPSLLTLLALIGGLSLSVHSQAEDMVVKLTTAQLKSAGVTVAAARAPDQHQTATGNTLRLTGRVAIPNRGMEMVSATTAGQVQVVLVNVGETVRVGTPLARIYSAELLSLQREYLQARSSAELSAQKLQRDESLLKDGIIAASRLQETRIADAQAQASLQEQQQLLKLAGMSDAGISKLVNASNINPVQTITASLNGVVLEQSAAPGSRVEPGSALFKLGNTQTLWVELQATQAQLGQLSVGNAASAVGCAVAGKVIAINAQVSRDSQTALVRTEFANASKCLKPNQFAEVDLHASGTTQNVVSIPAKALLRSGGKDYVFVQTAAGFRLQEVSVQSRQRIDQTESAWVNATLAVGTQVAVSGVAALRGAASGLGSEE